jgi:hypothetical protein
LIQVYSEYFTSFLDQRLPKAGFSHHEENRSTKLGEVAYFYNPGHSAGENWEDSGQGQPSEKFMRPYLNQ